MQFAKRARAGMRTRVAGLRRTKLRLDGRCAIEFARKYFFSPKTRGLRGCCDLAGTNSDKKRYCSVLDVNSGCGLRGRHARSGPAGCELRAFFGRRPRLARSFQGRMHSIKDRRLRTADRCATDFVSEHFHHNQLLQTAASAMSSFLGNDLSL